MSYARSLRFSPHLCMALSLILLSIACSQGSDGKPDTSQADTSAALETDSGGRVTPPDISTATDTATADSGSTDACPGGSGCACAANDDCDSSMCMEGPGGRRCAPTCVDSCAKGFSCAQVSNGSDVVLVCVSNWSRLCSPCEQSKDCNHAGVTNARCIAGGATGNYCGSGCASDDDCPGTHACKTTKDVDGNAAKQCMPVDASGKLTGCSCSKNAVDLALKTPCSKSVVDAGNSLICLGQAQCKTAGEPAECQAAAPAPEKCDGLDNDCDGLTDEASCDDKNPCTKDTCSDGDGTQGCKHTPIKDGTTCDADGSVCTVGDACKSGTCEAGPAKTCDDKNPCTIDSCDLATGCTQVADDGVPCDDENPCTIGDVCTGKQCKSGVPKSCPTTDFCVVSKCDLTKDGKCGYENKKAGTTCDDGDACTKDDGCEKGGCSGKKVSCDDKNVCTDDSCDPKKGCSYKANTAPCSDGNACTLLDTCAAKLCKAGAAKTCDDKQGCTVDSCEQASGKCVFNAKPKEGTACDADGSVCTVADVCKSGSCVAGAAKSCDDSNVCTDDTCDPKAGCQLSNNVTQCDDSDACTNNDACAKGTCGGAKVVCDDANPCTMDTCDTKSGCKAAALKDKTSCSLDGKSWCISGKCVLKAGDGAPCTTGAQCVSGYCTDGVCCDAVCGNACLSCLGKHTGAADGLCKPSKAGTDPDSDCTTSDVSTCGLTGMCDGAAKCAKYKSGTECKGVACLPDGSHQAAGLCAGGSCIAGKKTNCNDGNSCTTDTCDTLKLCVHTETGKVCDDKDACTNKDLCGVAGTAKTYVGSAPAAFGVCAGGKLSCDDGKVCTNDSCDVKTGCLHVNNTGSCSDGDICTLGDTCNGGTCTTSAKKVCDDGKVCTDNGCDAKSGCVYTKNTASCDDGDTCTTGDTCANASCVPGKKKNCDDANACTNDSCDAKTGCQHVNNTALCSDGDACTKSDKCSGGSCKGVGMCCPASTWPCHVNAYSPTKDKCVLSLATEGSVCGAKKGICTAGACIWTDKAKRKWGLVPSGKFQMGCNSAIDFCGSYETPQHPVSVTKSYWLGLYEVQVSEYEACVKAGKCGTPGSGASDFSSSCKQGIKLANWSDVGPVAGRAAYPLNCVTWARAAAYCAWTGGRLATEAEWEMAARGRCDENGGASGCAKKMRVYPWGNSAPVCGKQAVYNVNGYGCGYGSTWPVSMGAKQGRGVYGHYDLAGNIGEWVADYWGGSFYKSLEALAADPQNKSVASDRAVRGGNALSITSSLRASNRSYRKAGRASATVGVRCVRPF